MSDKSSQKCKGLLSHNGIKGLIQNRSVATCKIFHFNNLY